MTSAVSELLCDLADENDTLHELLVTLEPEDWLRDTPAEGWTVRDQVSHLAYVDRRGVLAINDPETFAAEAAADAGDRPDFLRRQLELGRTESPAELLEQWRVGRSDLVTALGALDPDHRIAWYGPSMSARSFATARLMEVFAHGVDIRDALGVPVVASRRLRHVARLGWLTRRWSYVNRGLQPSEAPLAVILEHDGESFVFGDPAAEQYVRGPLLDFCLVVTQRRHVDDVALDRRGPDADAWLRIAQAFAGPPGPGRAPL